jgi:hypothetical protein
MSATEGSSSPVSSSSSYCIDGNDSAIDYDFDNRCNSNPFYIKKNALKKRSNEMFQVASDLIARKSEHADYAVGKYVDALKACTRHGETEWDAIFYASEDAELAAEY